METTAERPEPTAGSGTEVGPDIVTAAGAAAGIAASPGRRPRDMVISLLVLLVPLGLIVGMYRVLYQGDQPVVIDPAQAVAAARGAGFPVAEPAGLAEDWRPASAVFQPGPDGATLRLGYLTPGGSGVQVVQSTEPVQRLLPRELGDSAEVEGVIDVAGDPWQSYRAGRRGQALVWLEADRTIVVIGNAAEAELLTLAGALTHTSPS